MSPCSWGDIFTGLLRGDRIIGPRQSKILDCANVAACGIFRIITTLELFQHHFSQVGHRETSCDPHLPHKPSSNQRSTTSRVASAAGRLRPNALTGKVDFTPKVSDYATPGLLLVLWK